PQLRRLHVLRAGCDQRSIATLFGHRLLSNRHQGRIAMSSAIAVLWRVLLGAASFGLVSSTVYLGLAVIAVARFKRRAADAERSVAQVKRDQLPPVTIFKPVHGMEERIEQNLESFFQQDYPA